MPAIATAASTSSAIRPQRFSPAGALWRSISSRVDSRWSAGVGPASGLLSGIGLFRSLFGISGRRTALPGGAGRMAIMQDTENHRHKQKRGAGGADQAAD